LLVLSALALALQYGTRNDCLLHFRTMDEWRYFLFFTKWFPFNHHWNHNGSATNHSV